MIDIQIQFEHTGLEFTYRNWRGETRTRQACPLGLRWGSSRYHPETQWLLRATDLEKDEEREFALKDEGRVRSSEREVDEGVAQAVPGDPRGVIRHVKRVCSLCLKRFTPRHGNQVKCSKDCARRSADLTYQGKEPVEVGYVKSNRRSVYRIEIAVGTKCGNWTTTELPRGVGRTNKVKIVCDCGATGDMICHGLLKVAKRAEQGLMTNCVACCESNRIKGTAGICRSCGARRGEKPWSASVTECGSCQRAGCPSRNGRCECGAARNSDGSCRKGCEVTWTVS